MYRVRRRGFQIKRKTRGSGEVVEKDCQACKLNKEDARDRSRWRKLIRDVWWSGWVWVGECFFWYRPTRVVLDKRPLRGCVCVWLTYLLTGWLLTEGNGKRTRFTDRQKTKTYNWSQHSCATRCSNHRNATVFFQKSYLSSLQDNKKYANKHLVCSSN